MSGASASTDGDWPVLQSTPHRTYVGHGADVLDLAWSKSQFLLTASMDKTVRLWHISMEDCLRVFKCALSMPHSWCSAKGSCADQLHRAGEKLWSESK